MDDVDLLGVWDQLSVPGTLALLTLLAENQYSMNTYLHDRPFSRITDSPAFEICPQWHNTRRLLINTGSRE